MSSTLPTSNFPGSTWFDTFHQCNEASQLSLGVKNFVVENRIGVGICGLTALNIISRFLRTSYISQWKAYPFLTVNGRRELETRCMQFIFGMYIALSGYAFGLYTLATGCNANEIYLFSMGGMWLVLFDGYEILQRWPLPPTLLLHHVAVIFLGLAIFEWRVLPSRNPDEQFSWELVLLVANIGATWVSDFFHAVYRTSFSLSFTQTFRKFYFALASVRLVNFLCFCSMSWRAKQKLGPAASGALALVTFAYGYTSWKAVKFVYDFDCEQYFAQHQAKWNANKIEN